MSENYGYGTQPSKWDTKRIHMLKCLKIMPTINLLGTAGGSLLGDDPGTGEFFLHADDGAGGTRELTINV